MANQLATAIIRTCLRETGAHYKISVKGRFNQGSLDIEYI